MMRKIFWMAGIAVLLPLLGNGLSKTEFFRVEDLKPGMKGIGKTCYQGSRPEEFQVEILGVLRGVGPGAHAVLARFSGGPLDRTGVFEGMSGSPVFIDGKLLGAVSFSYPFSKEAIGGITPITQMVDAFTESKLSLPGPTIILKRSMLWKYQLPSPGTGNNLKDLMVSARDIQLQPELAPFGGHVLSPIATPLSLAGFNPQVLQVFGPQLRSLGLTILQGTGGVDPRMSASLGAGLQTATDLPPLEPGSNIIIPLIRGDLDASAGGTVTHIDGDKIYAFGHMLFNLGFTELPFHRGNAITVFPSLQSSFKILETGDAAGAILQDRNSGVYGVLGQKARMLPLVVHVSTSRGVQRDLKYEIARDRFLTPLLVNLTIYNSIVASERSMGIQTVQVKGTIRIKGQEAVEIENRFSSEGDAPISAALSIAVPVNFLLAAGYEGLDLEGINIDITSQEEDRAALLDSIRFPRAEVKAGDIVPLQIFYRKANGELLQDDFPIPIPAEIAPGPVTMVLADGASLMSLDAQEQGEELVPRDLTQLIKFINSIRKNDRLYIRLTRREAGAVVNGEGLPGLPPSILSILRSGRSAGGMVPIQTSTFMEYELPQPGYIVSGIKTLNLEIKP
jgi:hypothetical protein